MLADSQHLFYCKQFCKQYEEDAEMSKITHYAKLKPKTVANYYYKRYHFTADDFKGVDEQTASYLRKNKDFEVITKNQYKKEHESDKQEGIEIDKLDVKELQSFIKENNLGDAPKKKKDEKEEDYAGRLREHIEAKLGE